MDLKKDTFKKNKYLLVGFLVIIVVASLIYVYFDNIKNFWENFSSVSPDAIKELDVMVFYDPSNAWSQKMMTLLESQNLLDKVTLVDAATNKELVEKYNVKHGVPAFYSKKYDTMSVGFKNSIQDVINELTTGKPTEQPAVQRQNPIKEKEKMINDLNIWVFTREGCGHCTHAKQDIQTLKDLGMDLNIKILDAVKNPSEYEKYKQMAGLNINGVPVFYSNTTKKNQVGYATFDKIIEQLS